LRSLERSHSLPGGGESAEKKTNRTACSPSYIGGAVRFACAMMMDLLSVHVRSERAAPPFDP